MNDILDLEILDEVGINFVEADIIENTPKINSTNENIKSTFAKTEEKNNFNYQKGNFFSLKSSSFNQNAKRFTRPILNKIPLLKTPIHPFIPPASIANFNAKDNFKMLKSNIPYKISYFEKRVKESVLMNLKNEESAKLNRPISKQKCYINKRANESLKKALNILIKQKALNEGELKEITRKSYINNISKDYKKFNGTKYDRIKTAFFKEFIKDEHSNGALSKKSSNHYNTDLRMTSIDNLYNKTSAKNPTYFKDFGDIVDEKVDTKKNFLLSSPSSLFSFSTLDKKQNNFVPLKLRMPDSPKRTDLYKVGEKFFPENYRKSHQLPKKYGKYEKDHHIRPLLDDCFFKKNSDIRLHMPETPKPKDRYIDGVSHFSARHDHSSHYQPSNKYKQNREFSYIQPHSRKFSDDLNHIKPYNKELSYEMKYGSKLKIDKALDKSISFDHNSYGTNTSKNLSSNGYNYNVSERSDARNSHKSFNRTERTQKEIYGRTRQRSTDNPRKRSRSEIVEESYNQNKYMKSDKTYEKSNSSKFIDKNDYCSYLRNLGREHDDSSEKLNERKIQSTREDSLSKCIQKICTEALRKRQRREF